MLFCPWEHCWGTYGGSPCRPRSAAVAGGRASGRTAGGRRGRTTIASDGDDRDDRDDRDDNEIPIDDAAGDAGGRSTQT